MPLYVNWHCRSWLEILLRLLSSSCRRTVMPLHCVASSHLTELWASSHPCCMKSYESNPRPCSACPGRRTYVRSQHVMPSRPVSTVWYSSAWLCCSLRCTSGTTGGTPGTAGISARSAAGQGALRPRRPCPRQALTRSGLPGSAARHAAAACAARRRPRAARARRAGTCAA